MSSSMSPEELVELLNEVYTHYDALVERHGLYKVRAGRGAGLSAVLLMWALSKARHRAARGAVHCLGSRRGPVWVVAG